MVFCPFKEGKGKLEPQCTSTCALNLTVYATNNTEQSMCAFAIMALDTALNMPGVADVAVNSSSTIVSLKRDED